MRRLIDPYRLNEKVSSLVSYFLVSAMLFCLGIAARDVASRLLPDREMTYLPYFCLFVAIIGIYSQRKMHHALELETNPLVYRAVEWVVILVILKLATYIWNGFEKLIVDLPHWQANFIENFFDAEYILGIMIIATVWTLALSFVDDLFDLEGDVDILQASSLDIVVSNRSMTQGHLVNKVFSLGIGLVIVSTLSRLDYATISSGLRLSKQSYIHVLAYFLLGFVLLSLTQLATRRAAWAWEHIPVVDGLARNWIAYSVGFLFVLSLLAFMLPTNYTLGFLPTLGYLFSFLFGLIYTFVMTVILIISFIFGWVMNLIGISKADSPQMKIPEQVFPEMPPVIVTSPMPWLEVLKSILFWGILLLVIGYAFYAYFRQNKELLQKLRRLPGLSWLVKAWRWVISKTRSGVRLIPRTVAEGFRRVLSSLQKETGRNVGGYLHVNRLEPRQKILFYYHALVRRSGETGIPRQPWQTPRNYAETLEPNLAGAEADIESMTEAFIEARYTQHVVDPDQVGRVQRAWNNLRKIFNTRRKG